MSTTPEIDHDKTAIVSGAGRGFGRAIAVALVSAGWQVVGVARTTADLESLRADVGDRFTPVPGDATDEALGAKLIAQYLPQLLVLNAGATPHTAPLTRQTWETFSENWNTDTRHVFGWSKAALNAPLKPGSTVIAMSSGAALRGSPLSGGFAGANATVKFISDYAADEAEQASLGIRFVTLYPMLSPTGVGAAGVAAYSAQQGVDPETFIARLQPVLTPEIVAKAVVELSSEPAPAAGYVLTATGASPL
ncbi:SDR family oxidoreductase [Mycobacterium sp. CBMA293]|uniref:SDR family oxidoreductase n=1 Tax=unclassified Mycolicibacterium TaxID=2636767 RepID=UPI0012DD4895|nr:MULTISPECIES: SDR family oxidoreductase [unclassified Mycolicibacterium]MUL47898.1 SDR family oxidoreductase [Mycolicibacterium sp. CBMA 360]MUL59254.1 SDR family oxidoreductase [Mycolicibacterium sp. CBMA 335]MUL70979.1 SDR family oxidoreductase [Mycolicibacterium sp. CBMA 311]MUL94622.1 SDR family oxidoreductase [Mycolicibacterium sp. CBMA 230]MUM09200.1 short-chain dehydrogenase [Mycolicibacterium sp. CBMA 213]